MELDGKACADVLQELRPQIGRYQGIWRILRLLSRVKGYVPPRAMKAFKPFFNAAKPYFVGTTSERILFLGDYRDKYSVDSMVQPEYDKTLVQFLQKRLQSCQGNYIDIGS